MGEATSEAVMEDFADEMDTDLKDHQNVEGSAVGDENLNYDVLVLCFGIARLALDIDFAVVVAKAVML